MGVAVSHVPGDGNHADVLTRPLSKLEFTKFRVMLGLRPLSWTGARLGVDPDDELRGHVRFLSV